MASSYENTIMPEKPEEQMQSDAIPVDDKGRPLPDPTESFSEYIAPKGMEELKKAYSEVEVDETVRETMEPPQKTGLLRKHRSGTKRGYDYYGTPAGSIPNDSNGLKPSPLSKLFSEAEALEPDFDINKIREHVLDDNSDADGVKVVGAPKNGQPSKKPGGAFEKDDILKRTEVVKDPNAPKFLEMYKESTNTRVIYQSDGSGDSDVKDNKSASDAEKIFAEHSQVTKAKKRISKREEKKAIKAAIKLEKKKAKERRKAEKAARKAMKKAKKNGTAVPEITTPDEIIKLQEETAAKAENEKAKARQNEEARRIQEEKDAAEKKALEEKEEAQKLLDEAERRKEEAELEAQHAAQEAEKKLREEKEKQEEEIKAAELEKQEAMRLLEEEKAAAQKAAKEAEAAREEAEKLKAELEKMKNAAAQALAQKQEAEEVAKLAREEKERLNEKVEKLSQQEKEKPQKEPAEKNPQSVKRDEPHKEERRTQVKTEKETAPKQRISAEKPKAAAPSNSKGTVQNSPTMEVIKRRLAEMEAQLSSKNSDE